MGRVLIFDSNTCHFEIIRNPFTMLWRWPNRFWSSSTSWMCSGLVLVSHIFRFHFVLMLTLLYSCIDELWTRLAEACTAACVSCKDPGKYFESVRYLSVPIFQHVNVHRRPTCILYTNDVVDYLSAHSMNSTDSNLTRNNVQLLYYSLRLICLMVCTFTPSWGIQPVCTV